jgi:hypothetical protein
MVDLLPGFKKLCLHVGGSLVTDGSRECVMWQHLLPGSAEEISRQASALKYVS